MLASHWQPWSEMNRLSREMDRLFSHGGIGRSTDVSLFPALNVWQDEDHFNIEAELAGFCIEDIEVYVTGNQLTLKGERKQPEHANGTWHRQERSYGRFARAFELPSDVDCDKAVADFKNGVLAIRLPKSEAAKPRRISVNAT